MVEEICTRVIIMDRGRKIADGTVAELAYAPIWPPPDRISSRSSCA
jgi:ABC-type multidrug transport system ATPase subunit